MGNVHICIVSDHLEANLIPVLQLRPETVVLVATQRMEGKAAVLAKVIESELPATRAPVYIGLPDDDVSAIEEFGLTLEEGLRTEFDGDVFIYNATGGTKIHALIFSQIFHGTEIVYANTQSNKLLDISSHQGRATTKMEPVLNAEIYLKCNGKRLRNHRSADVDWVKKTMDRKSVTLLLAKPKHQSVEWMMGDLNWMIRQNGLLVHKSRQEGAVFNPHKAIQQLKKKPVKDTLTLVNKFSEFGLVDRGNDERSIVFQNADSAEYLSGGWIEEYAYLVGKKLGIQEVLSSVQITDEANHKLDVRNEIDCLMVHNNRMLLIECKTAYYSENETEQEMLAKLDSLGSHSGGLFGTNVLLSFREVSDNMSNRAQALGIKVLDSRNLRSFEDCVKHWMATGIFGLPA